VERIFSGREKAREAGEGEREEKHKRQREGE
jgi:hypothetical protein